MAKPLEKSNALQELKTDIRNKETKRLYFFHGEETFLLHHYLEQLKKILLDDLTEAFNFHKLTSENFEVQSFGDCVENLPMMAENSLVWVDEIDIYKLPEHERERVAEIISDIPDYCTVVFTYVTVPWKPDARMRKFHEAVTKYGTVVEFAKQEPRDLIPWITRHFASKGKQIPSNLCAYLIDITGGTMTALAGEISKIAAYSGSDVIVKSDIDAVTEPVLDAVVFQLTDLMGQKEYGAALMKLQVLLKMQQDPIALLGAIGFHFRRLSTARILMDNGKPYGELMKLYAMSDYPARKTMSAAGRFSASFLEKAAKLVAETDYGMKTSLDTPERLLEVLVLQLAQEAQNA